MSAYRTVLQWGSERRIVYEGADPSMAHAMARDHRAAGHICQVERFVPSHWDLDFPCNAKNPRGQKCLRSTATPHTFHLYTGEAA